MRLLAAFRRIYERDREINAVSWIEDVIFCNAYLGLRRNKVCNLRWVDLDFESEWIRVQSHGIFKTKSGKARSIPLFEPVTSKLRYLSEKASTEWIFTGPNSQLAPRSVTHLFNRVCSEAGLEGYRFHDLRHSAISWLAVGGLDVRTLQSFAGHSSLAITQNYMHLSPSNRIKEMVKSGFRGINLRNPHE